ncbi:MAG: acetyl-CoA carboxylase carboxyl transferase subunit beta, partial [Alphaproteobacteria bacterium]|nr:acetyl-CoA carboxylase carboxyl transferase subunit beta [Alphaproteobacteria bacterium]
MNWITNLVRPKVKGAGGGKDAGRGDMPENLWKKCPSCGEMIFHRDLVANMQVCPKCGHHMRIGPAERFAYTFDPHSFSELPPVTVAADPLRFKAEKKYADEMKTAKAKTGRPEAFSAARGTIDGLPVLVAVQAFD